MSVSRVFRTISAERLTSLKAGPFDIVETGGMIQTIEPSGIEQVGRSRRRCRR